MKKLIQSYFSFNKAERTGFAGLLLLLLIVIVVKLALTYCTSPEHRTMKKEPLVPLPEKQVSPHILKPEILSPKTTIHENTLDNAALFDFDPNELDSAGFRQLGLKEKTTALLLNWRRKGKVFREKQEFKSLYTLTPKEYERLAPYIRIRQKRIDLNLADSVALLRLTGIGPKLAHKIIAYREENGKFTYIEQLFEIHRFADSTFSQLKKEVYIVETRAN